MLEASNIATGLSGRYASALYELARDGHALPAVERDIETLQRAIDASADLRRLLRNPVYSREQQWKALEELIQKMQLSDLTRRFVGVIAHNRRLFALARMLGDFIKLAAHFRGEMTARATTGQPMTPEQTRALEGALRTAMGRAVKLAHTVDPDLLGGLIVRVGSIMVDSSLRTKLNQLKAAMREVN